MNQMRLRKLAIAGSTFACAVLLSFSWSEQRGVSLSVESAQARVGRPLTPVSVAGVARRQNRRAAYGYGYYGDPNNRGGLVGGDDPGVGGGFGRVSYGLSVDSAQARRLYVSPYGHGPFRADLSGLSWDAVRAYYVGGPWCGVGTAAGFGGVGFYGTAGGLNSWTCYTGWADYAQRNGIG